MAKKVCRRCKTEKDIAEFYVYVRSGDGRQSYCKQCNHEYTKEYDDKNPIQHAIRSRRYKENNRAKVNENRKKRRAENPEKTKAESHKYELTRKGKRSSKKRDWYWKNAEKIKQYKREQYAKNPENDRTRALQWAKNNPEKSRARNHRKRQIKLNAPGNGVTPGEWKEILQKYEYKCLACGSTVKIELDHVVPLSKGGAHDPSNVQPLCKTCNCKKHDKTIDYRESASI